MKTAEEIKGWLEGCDDKSNCSWCLNGYQCERDAHTLAYIQQLESQVPKWISVDERLPEDDSAVLVYAVGNNENSCVAMTSYTHHMHGYNIEGWRSPWQYFFYERKITHWMPLPEPPEEEETCD